MNKYVCFLLFLLFSRPVFSQELRSATEIGLLIGHNDQFKKGLYYRSTRAGIEFRSAKGKSTRLMLMAGVSTLRYSMTGADGLQEFVINRCLSLPVYYRKYIWVGRQLRLFGDLGLETRIGLSEKKESRWNGILSKQRQSFDGVALGLAVNGGIKTMIGGKMQIELGLSSGGDIWHIRKSPRFIRYDDRITLYIGLAYML